MINHAYLYAQRAAEYYANQQLSLQEDVEPEDIKYLRKKTTDINRQWNQLVDEYLERNFFDD